jgi:hypothetical protein
MPLSSVLFTIHTADIARSLKTDNTTASTYVDDIVVEGQGNTQKEAVDELQRVSIHLEAWTEANKMSIQPGNITWMMASWGIQKELPRKSK